MAAMLGSVSSRGCLGVAAILWWWGDTHGWRLSLSASPIPMNDAYFLSLQVFLGFFQNL